MRLLLKIQQDLSNDQVELIEDQIYSKFKFVYSDILTEGYIKIIEFMIGKSIKLKLLFSAIKDDWSELSFHDRCDNKGETIIICECDNGNVFGAYSDKKYSLI